MKKREDLTLEEEILYLGKMKLWSEWIPLSKVNTEILNQPGLYEQSILINEERIIFYLGKTNSTLGSRFESYKKNGSHLKRFFRQFKEKKYVIEIRWREMTSMCTRKIGEDRPKLEESKILVNVDYILNCQENNRRRIEDLNILIHKLDKDSKEIVDIVEVKKNKLLSEESNKKLTKNTKEKTLDVEGWVLKKDGTRDKRYKGPIQ